MVTQQVISRTPVRSQILTSPPRLFQSHYDFLRVFMCVHGGALKLRASFIIQLVLKVQDGIN